MTFAIEAGSLSKSFGEIKALDNVSFCVREGEIFGFLGPNGAGKTTTIRILTTLIRPTSGTAKVLGYDVISEADEIRKRIGVVTQRLSYEFSLTVEKALELYGFLWGVPKAERRKKVQDLLKLFDLNQVRNRLCHDLSIGMRRRVQVAREFIHDMEVLFLDEPTIGMDPFARRATLDLLKEKVKDGLTIFFTTHIMQEAEYLCDRIAVLNHGRIEALDNVRSLKDKISRLRTVELTLTDNTALYDKFIDALMDSFSENMVYALKEVESEEKHVNVLVVDPPEEIYKILNIAKRYHLKVKRLSLREPSLEDVFIKIVKASEALNSTGEGCE